jgi:hypothetical protein
MNWPTEEEKDALYFEWLNTEGLSGLDLINMTVDLIKAKNPQQKDRKRYPDKDGWPTDNLEVIFAQTLIGNFELTNSMHLELTNCSNQIEWYIPVSEILEMLQ